MRLTGSDGELWDLPTLKRKIPHLNYGPDARFPKFIGASAQLRAGRLGMMRLLGAMPGRQINAG
ncbi:MAG: hypothetical protein CM1200mP18_21700 [Gammaproteobacteria bacterium]|nr:MAG: hypothetical protein CM1200mP18_21700 [Gammaproteobacteria bacterium]